MRRQTQDLILGAILIAASLIASILASEPGGPIDATALIIALPLGIYQIAKPLIWAWTRPRTEQRKMAELFEIRSVRGHYEAYISGRFICSGDTRRECAEAAEEFVSAA